MNVWKEAKAQNGRTYYYHVQTQETRWDKPEDYDAPVIPITPATPAAVDVEGTWQEARTAEGRVYYWHTGTKKTAWEPPPGLNKTQPPARPSAPAFVAGGAPHDRSYDVSDRRLERRDDRDHGLPQKPSFDGGREGGREGGRPWEQRHSHENTGYRGPLAAKTDEPEYDSFEQAEEAFFAMLSKQNITPDTTWPNALRQVLREREFRALKDPKERKQAFEKYCVEVRAQEKGKEKERRERLREEFRSMLKTHGEIKQYTRWKTARPMIERETVFRSAGDEDLRRQIFDEFTVELKRRSIDEEYEAHRAATQELEGLLKALIVDPNTKWSGAQEAVMQNERFVKDDKFKALSKVDILQAFDLHIKNLDRLKNDAKQKEKRNHSRRERQARDAFRALLAESLAQGKVKAGTKWQDFLPLIAEDERYINLVGLPGSSPLDLFWDLVEDEERKLRNKRNDALDVLEDQRFEMTTETTIEEFTKLMIADLRTANIGSEELRIIFDRLMEKVHKRAEDAKILAEKSQRKAIDALRSVIKHLEPPVRLGDKYEDIAPKLEGHPEFRALDDVDTRRSAFEKHIRRLKEKEEDLERERARRDRDRDRRNSARRDYDDRDGGRDRDRRHRTRTPEVDAYEADRRKAQADRERQYRKASFGLTPPPRERRDDRYDDRSRRHDRGDSIYDRERREREMERERSYISRADPRDKGRSLDYGDEDAVGSRPGSIRKRRDSDGSVSSRRESKRTRRDTNTPRRKSAEPMDIAEKEEPPTLQSGSEEGEIEEV